MKRKPKIILWIFIVALVLGFFLIMGEDEEDGSPYIARGGDIPAVQTDDTWAVYWYLCGSDLESTANAATMDLYEMLEVELPRNVSVVIQTGGSLEWGFPDISSNQLTRLVYDADGLRIADTLPNTSMGDPETLEDFLLYCTDNHPADRTMVLIWNHGGGSVNGAAYDEIFEDMMLLPEFYQAFENVYDLSENNPSIDVIGFDACLMATIDVGYWFSDIAHYLVASEELEPGIGWCYNGWLQDLAFNPSMDGAELGIAICDSYYEGCQQEDVVDEITLSVVNLQKIGGLLSAYEELGKEGLASAVDSPYFFSNFGRAASRSESYGGNTERQGYTNMVDLGHLVQNSRLLFPDMADEVLRSLDECVVYKVNGPYRAQASGLSCYYSYNKDKDNLQGFMETGASESFKYLYQYQVNGVFPDDGMEYLSSNLGYNQNNLLGNVPSLESYADEYFPVEISEDGYAVLEVGPDVANLLTDIYFSLLYVDETEDMQLLLGYDIDIIADWENGIFMDNFRGVWGSIDGCLVYMEVVYSDENYASYNVPILLNGEFCNLAVVYSFVTEEYRILGARRELSDSGMADKSLVKLRPGDEITTVLYLASHTGDDDFEAYEVDTFVVSEDTRFEEMDMGDGVFWLMFEMVDSQGIVVLSEVVEITVEAGEIYLGVI